MALEIEDWRLEIGDWRSEIDGAGLRRIRTGILEIAFDDGGPPDGRPVLLLHGWPGFCPRVDRGCPPAAGWRFRPIAPYLRHGSSPTRFLSPDARGSCRRGAGPTRSISPMPWRSMASPCSDTTGALARRTASRRCSRAGDGDCRAGARLPAARPVPRAVLRAVEALLVPVVLVHSTPAPTRSARIRSASRDFSGRPGARPAGSTMPSSPRQRPVSPTPIGSRSRSMPTGPAGGTARPGIPGTTRCSGDCRRSTRCRRRR